MKSPLIKMLPLRLTNIRACVFDAFGTLFDVNSAAANAHDALGQNWQPLADIWHTKQPLYNWLRLLMGRYVNFWRVTEDALDYAMTSLKLMITSLHRKLMALYIELDVYPEVKEVPRFFYCFCASTKRIWWPQS